MEEVSGKWIDAKRTWNNREVKVPHNVDSFIVNSEAIILAIMFQSPLSDSPIRKKVIRTLTYELSFNLMTSITSPSSCSGVSSTVVSGITP